VGVFIAERSEVFLVYIFLIVNAILWH
jgi:hypothetical protein